MKRIIAVVVTALLGFGFTSPAFGDTLTPPAAQAKAFHCGAYFHGHTVRSYEWRSLNRVWRVTTQHPDVRLTTAAIYDCQRNA